MSNPFERRSSSQEKKTTVRKEIGPMQVPEFVKVEFQRLRDVLLQEIKDAELSTDVCYREDLGGGMTRYRLIKELRDADTRSLTQSSPLMNLTPRGMYKGIHMIVDVKGNDILKTEIDRNPPGWSFLRVQ